MGPKVLADVRFAENGEKNAIIASLERTWQALQGDSGTKITS
jgi:carbamate kinase